MTNLAPDSNLDLVFAALSDKARRAILERLSAGSATVTELAAPFAMSLPAVSKHLRVLENAGLISRSREGRIHRMSLSAERLGDAAAWLEHYRRFWNENFESLADFLQETADEHPNDDTNA